MKKQIFIMTCMSAFLVFNVIACKKSKDDGGPNTIVEAKLTNKDWKSSKTGTPWVILRFNSDNTGYEKAINNLINNTYNTFNFNWAKKGGDSLKLSYTTVNTQITLKVYSVNDSVLVTNNFVMGGATDTTRVEYYK